MQEFFEIECTLEELYEYEKINHVIENRKIFINTKYGLKKIENIDYTALNEATYLVETESRKNISVSSNHILFSDDKEIKVNNIIINNTCIETIYGNEIVTNVEFIGFNNLMDIQVEEVHEFYTSSGIRTHNSSLSDTIKFGIYGKLENKRLKDIPNRLNKNTYVKIVLETRKGLVEIERGLEPNFFNLKINGTLVDKAGKRSVQEFLEEELLEMPFYVFSNTLSLSIDDFKSFIKMSNADKKAIIDKIFGLQIINQMRDMIKAQTKKLKENIENLSATIMAFDNSFVTFKVELENLENKIKEKSLVEKDSLLEESKLYQETKTKYNENIQKIDEKIDSIKNISKKVEESISTDLILLNSYKEKINLYNSCKCPTCEADLTTTAHQSLLSEYKKSYEESNTRINVMRLKRSKVNLNLEKIYRLKQDGLNALTGVQIKLNNVNNKLREMGEVVNMDDQTESLKNMMFDFTEKIKNKKEEQIKSQRSVAFYNLAEEILGDKGVKQLAIKSIIPPLNVEIGKLVKTLGIDHKIVFNEDFDARISHFGVEVSADTLSTGEMKKIDFAVLLAVVRMMKIKFPYMNMLFLDELFSNIDASGQYHILKILRDVVKEYKLNIFVISHFPLSETEFDYTIKIEKTGGFSSFNVEKTI